MKYFFLLLFSYFNFNLNSQNLEWANSIGSSWVDIAYASAIDKNNNLYLTGTFSGEIDFDPSNDTFEIKPDNLNSNVFITKQNSNGELIWAKNIGGSGGQQGKSISVDHEGNVYVTGWFTGTPDFDPSSNIVNITSNGLDDVFLLKLDSNGNFEWVKTFGSFSIEYARFVTNDKQGNVYISGEFQETVDFNPNSGIFNLKSFGNTDVFVVKLDKYGNFIRANQFGGTNFEYVWALDIDYIGNLYIAGSFWGTSDFDPSLTNTYNLSSNGNSDMYVLKLDSNGIFNFVKQFGGSGPDDLLSLKIDSNGNFYIAGFYSNSVDFDPSSNTYNLNALSNWDGFIGKYKLNGDFVWVKGIEGNNSEKINSISLDKNENVYSTGEFWGIADFDPDTSKQLLNSLNTWDAFILKLDSNGIYSWANRYGGTNQDIGFSINIDKQFNVYCAGGYRNTVDFNFKDNITYNLTSKGSFDFFYLKLNQCQSNLIYDTVNACSDYLSPSKRYIWKTNGEYLDTIINPNGCDTIYHTLFKINKFNKAVNIIGNYLISNDQNCLYQWLLCDSNYSIILNATNDTFIPKKNGNYAVLIIRENCLDTSECIQISKLNTQNKLVEKTIIYPNPINEKYTIELNEINDVKKIILMNIDGKIVYEYNINTEINSTLIFNQDSGIYFLQVLSSNGEITTHKIIKL